MKSVHKPGLENWPDLPVLNLVITATWSRPNRIDDRILGNVLRGAFGIEFRRLVCPPGWIDNDCAVCPLHSQCPYGQVFRPKPTEHSTQLSKQSDLPRPFVLQPVVRSRFDSKNEGLATSAERTDERTLRFGLVLVGSAINSLSHFALTLNALGKQGMGPSRVPFRLEEVLSVSLSGELVESLFESSGGLMHAPQRLIGRADIIEAVEKKLGADVEIHFLTPTLLRSGSGVDTNGLRVPAKEIRSAPPFGILIRRLRDRLSSLTSFYASCPWERDDFADIGRLADDVELRDNKIRWEDRSRRSSRTGQSHELSGFVGSASYHFPTNDHQRALMPLIHYGELIHVGKNSVWGNGMIQVKT